MVQPVIRTSDAPTILIPPPWAIVYFPGPITMVWSGSSARGAVTAPRATSGAFQRPESKDLLVIISGCPPFSISCNCRPLDSGKERPQIASAPKESLFGYFPIQANMLGAVPNAIVSVASGIGTVPNIMLSAVP